MKKETIDNYIIKELKIEKDYIMLLLENENGCIEGRIRDNLDLFCHTFKVNDKIKCNSKLRKKDDKQFLDIIYVTMCNSDVIKNESKKIDDLKKRFETLCNEIKDEEYKKIINSIFLDDILDLFLLCPASEKHHHNYQHGLLEHTIEVVEISLFLGNYFDNINKDLLITGALLHDIGKLKSYDFDQSGIIVKTNWDKLLGHISISALFVSKIISSDITPIKMMLLYHLILSQHECKELGSPIECKTQESFILSQADNISSKINSIKNMDFINGWSKTELMNRKWFKTGDING